MAFPTSTSAFGMKPASTSIFGQPQQQQQTGAFGGAPALGQTQPQQTTNLFGGFGQQQQQQQPTGTGLFGQSTQPQQQQPATGLFGQSTQPQQQQQPTTGLFGQPQQQQQQQQPTTGLFGQSIQPQQQQPTTSLFGQPQQQQQQQPQQTQGSSLFSGPLFSSTQQQPQQQAQQQQPQQSTFGGFGGFGAQQQQPQQQQQQPQGTGLFGSTTTQAQPSLFGGTGTTGGFGLGSTLFGSKSQAPQQQQQQFGAPAPSTGFGGFGQTANLGALTQPNAPPPFTNKTKFNDLSDQMKSILENIDSYIQGRVLIAKEIQQRKLGEEATKAREEMIALRKDVVNTATAIRNDLHVTQDLKAKVDQAVEDTIVATRIIDGFRNPQSGHTYLKDHAEFPLEYFTRVADQMKERLAWYKSTIEQIERKLASVSSSAQTPQSISATLQAQHATFLALASKTAAVDAELQKIKALYTQLWRAKTGSVRDPFNDVAKPAETGTDFGLAGLSVR